MNNYSSSSSATITSFESQKHDCWVIERKDQLKCRYEMSCTTAALNSKCLKVFPGWGCPWYVGEDPVCLWQQRTPSFGNIWTSSFLKSPKRLISNCSWTWSSLTLAGKLGVWAALANVKLQMAKIGSKLFFPRNLMWSSFCLLFNLLRQRRSTDGDSKGSSPEKENTWLDST